MTERANETEGINAASAALINLAGLFQQQGRLEEAEQTYRRVLELGDTTTVPMATYAIGMLAAQAGRDSEAVALLQEAADSGDPEYAPLAAYDLGTLLSVRGVDIGHAGRALHQAAQSGHAEYGPRGWFNLAMLFVRAGLTAEAEAAYKRAIATTHTEIAPMAAVNLGGLLEDRPERAMDAEAAYRYAIASGHPDQAPMAAANLGNVLAALPGRLADAEVAYRGAMVSRHPQHAPRAAYNLGVMLVADSTRRADAEAAFRVAVESGDPHHAPRALYNLGRLLGEDSTRWGEARRVLETAAASSDLEVAAAGSSTLAHLLEVMSVDLLDPPLAQGWRCIAAAAQGGLHHEEYLASGETTSDWTEIVTVRRIDGRAGLTPEKYMAIIRDEVERARVDGRLTWEIIARTENELTYESTLAEDVAAQDQTELVRIVQGASALYTVQHAVRGDLARAARSRDERLRFLAAARVVRRPPPEVAAPRVHEGEEARVRDAMWASDEPALGRIARCRDVLATFDKRRAPETWAALQLQLAQLLLLQGGDEATDDILDEAATAIRRALEVFSASGMPDLRARSLRSLAFVLVQRAHRVARAGVASDGEAERSLLRHAVAALDAARGAFPPGSVDWAEMMIDRGDALLSLDADAAVATYTEMLAAVENMPPLADSERGAGESPIVDLVVRAIAGIQSVDRMRGGTPVVPAGTLERDKRGKVLYLRPLLSAGSLRLTNRCVAGAFAAGYEREPDDITLEALLYRALGEQLSVMTLGGRPEGYGGTRFVMASGGTDWQATLRMLASSADLLVMVPHVSEGVRWEIEYLGGIGALERTLFVMPPLSMDTDVATMWRDAMALLAGQGLQPPDYVSEGGIIRFGDGGAVAERWPFDALWANTLVRDIDHLLPPARA